MAKVCSRCGVKLGLLSYQSPDGLCSSCETEVQEAKDMATREAIKRMPYVIQEIAETKAIDANQLSYLQGLEPIYRDFAYNDLVTWLLADKELDIKEAALLMSLHKDLALDPTKSTFIDKVVPSYYVSAIRNKGALPVASSKPLMKLDVILKKGEIPHYYCNSVLTETRVKTGFVSGSQGVSIRVMKGVYYRIGGTRGHITKEEQLVETSRGTLIITNERMLLHPEKTTKPVSIPINKILSYKCYDDGVALYKDGREKPFIFLVNHAGDAETIGICLGFLCSGS